MNKGFTLLEFSIYIALTSVVLIAAGAIGLNILFGKAKLSAIEEISSNTRFAVEKMAAAIRNAEAINSPATSTSATFISLEMASSTINPTIFRLSNEKIEIQEGTSDPSTLTSSEALVTNLRFYNISRADTRGTIRIQLHMKSSNPSGRQEYEFGKTFYTTAHVREK